MYAMWWNKPLTPKEPILAGAGDWVAEVLAFMYMSSEVSGTINERQMKSQTVVKTLFASLHVYSKTPEVECICLRSIVGTELSDPPTALSIPREPCHDRRLVTCQNSSTECKTVLDRQRLKEAGTAFFERRPRVHVALTADMIMSTCSRNRYKLLISAVDQDLSIQENQVLVEHQLSDGSRCVHFKSEQLLAEYSRNWPSDELLRDVGGLVVGMVLWLANFFYGGIHAAAWNDHFPSSVEKWLWRSSASYIGFCGGLWVILNYVVSSYQPLNDFWEHWMDGKKGWFHNITLGSLVFI